MNAQHTAGPFSYNAGTGFVVAAPCANFRHGQVVAKVMFGPGKNSHANGHLFSAAPDLLAALEEFLASADAGHVSVETDAKARAAIAKARGAA